MGRPLPTQGMQMIAFAAVLGFKKIYVAGIDLYEDAASRYAWNVPDEVRSQLKEKDYSGGYESNHDLEVDLMFLRAIREQRSEEHTSELQSLMRISYAVFCLNKKRKRQSCSGRTAVREQSLSI